MTTTARILDHLLVGIVLLALLVGGALILAYGCTHISPAASLLSNVLTFVCIPFGAASIAHGLHLAAGEIRR